MLFFCGQQPIHFLIFVYYLLMLPVQMRHRLI